MAYSDFTLEAVVEQFGLVEKNEALFATVQPIPASDWLTETLSISQKWECDRAPKKLAQNLLSRQFC